MIQQYVLYNLTTPFLGYIKEWGHTDPEALPDGSTSYERVQRMLVKYPDLALHLFAPQVITEKPDPESKKFDPGTEALVDLGVGDITPAAQAVLTEAAKAQSLEDNIPSWAQVDTAITSIASLADAKAFLRKLARVVYWLAKNTEV